MDNNFELLLEQISSRFINLSMEDIDLNIVEAQKKICEYFKLDRSVLWIFDKYEPGKILRSHWFGAADTAIPEYQMNANATLPWIFDQTLQKKTVVFESLKDLPQDAFEDYSTLKKLGIKSSVIIPLTTTQTVFGALVFSCLKKRRAWDKKFKERLPLISEIFCNVLAYKKKERESEERLKFESLLVEISSNFVSLAAHQVDDQIEKAQKLICECLNVEASSLWQLTEETASPLRLTHVHAPSDWQLHPGKIDAKEVLPWVTQKVLNGELLLIDTEGMPPEASLDKKTRRSLRVKSSIVIPLCAGNDSIIGVLSFDTLRKERLWSEALQDRLNLIAQIFSNALARKRMEIKRNEQFEEIKTLKEKLKTENIELKRQIEVKYIHDEIIARSSEMKKVLEQVEQVAQTDSTVLVQGETGTGKELIAKAVHRISNRKSRPLISINCASLPPTLVESELFGREKGAYTGALTRMKGRFEIADNATLFLDEVGELPLEIQAKLLRVLEQGSFERLGSTQTIKTDVRIIAATNQNLEKLVSEGKFRKDLYFRLNIFPIFLQPLRRHIEDIPPLVWSFVRELEKKMGKRIDHISKECMDALQGYQWPGNVRELKNLIERAIIVSNDTSLKVNLPEQKNNNKIQDGQNLEDIERKHILSVLEKTGWKISGKGSAAEILGLKRTTLQSKMKKLGVDRP